MTADWVETNRARWDERVSAHAASELYDLEGVVAGRDDLRPWEDAELGPLDGRDVVHLQCHIGTDTVGLARRGARTVGLDFSAPALEVAASMASRCGLSIEWVVADVYDAVEALGGRTFDVVYTGIGALPWLPDVQRWASVAASLVRPGGFLYLTELHPMWAALMGDGCTIGEDALGAPFTFWDDEPGTYAAPDAVFETNASWQRLHSLGDVLSAVLDAGLQIELFHEWDVTPSPTPWLTLGPDKLYRFPEGMYRFPLTFSLRARAARAVRPGPRSSSRGVPGARHGGSA